MDPLTHALFGSLAAQSRARKEEFIIALLIGITAGMFPDSDVLIRSAADPLLSIQYHRHFTHALFFVPFGALFISTVFWPFAKKHIRFVRLYLFAFVAMGMHGIIDATTSYGTHLLWPFTNARESWSIMSIIDPIVTLPLLIGVIMATIKRSHKILYISVAIVALYFAFGALQHIRVKQAMMTLAEKRGHTIEHYEIKPTLFNSIVWRSTYSANDRIYIDGIRSSIMGEIVYYQGESVPHLNVKRDFPTLEASSTQNRDIERFRFFSAGFLAVSPKDKNVIADMRYALLPDSTSPLWGIRLDLDNQDTHVRFETYRQRTPETLQKFWHQLKGLDGDLL